MDHIEEGSEELRSEAFEYTMPLNGPSPSPRGGRSADSEDTLYHDAGGVESHHGGGAHNGGTPVGWPSSSSRRSSSHTDATPRFENKAGGRFNFGSEAGGTGLPSVPFHDRSDRSSGKGNSLSAFLAKNGGSQVSFNLDPETNDDMSEPSLPLHALGVQLTPTSNAPSTYSRRDPTRRSVQHIGMDGAIQTLPISPAAESHVSNASTMNSHGILSHSEQSPRKYQKTEDKRRSYFTATQELPLGSESLHSIYSGTEHYPTERSKEYDTDDDFDMFSPIGCCGYDLPVWFSTFVRSIPSLNRISLFLVNVMPCFWCCGSMIQGSSTDRTVLTRLNVVCLFVTFGQVVASMWLASLLLIVDDEPGALKGFAPNFWNLNGATFSIGILAFVLILMCSYTIRVIKEVDLAGVIRSLWVLLWIVPFEIFFSISLYDYYNVTEVWISHWWLQDTLSWFRGHFCEEGTEFTKCLVPIQGGPDYDTETEWCLANYNATNCSAIRNEAQKSMGRNLLVFYTGLAGWSTVLVFFMILMVNSLEGIITRPIVQKSRETNVPAWLSLPTITNALVGAILLYSPSSLLSSGSGAESSWIGIVYMVAAGLFLVALLTGWFLSAYTIRNHGDKQTKNAAVIVMIFVMTSNVIMLATIFGASILFSADLINAPIDESQRGEVACGVDRGVSCTNCDATVHSERCPEWSLEDVTKILQTQLKQSATLAAIFILYAIGVLRFAVTLRRHLSLYQIDYV